MVRYLCLVFVILKDFSEKINLLGNFKILKVVLVKLIGVNTGRPVTLKYLIILININRKHRLFTGPDTSISLICIVVKSDI